MARDFIRSLVLVFRGALATSYACPYCKHHEVVRYGRPGVGRGAGLRLGGGAHSRLSAHIRAEHANMPKFAIYYVEKPGDQPALKDYVLGMNAPQALLTFFKTRNIIVGQNRYITRMEGHDEYA